MTSSTSPDRTPDHLQALDDKADKMLAILKEIEAHMAALRKAFVPEDLRTMRFDYDKER